MYRKLGFVLLLLAVSTFAEIGTRTALYGGLALATGNGREDMNPGFDLRLEIGLKPIRFLSIGADIDYTWLSADVPDEYDEKAGTMFWDFSFAPKFYIPFTDDLNLSFGVNPGFCIARAYERDDNDSDSDAEGAFSLTECVTLNYRNFTTSFNFKSAFKDGESVNWVCFNVGICSRDRSSAYTN